MWAGIRRGASGVPALAWICILAALLHLPSLWIGYLADDYVHLWRIQSGSAPLRADLYDFAGARHAAASAEGGHFEAWWMSPAWKLTFVRPIASLSLSLDHWLFGARAALAHAENLAWFLLGLACFARVLRDLGLARREIHLGAALFAASSVTLVPVGWLANRNSLLELTLGLAGLAVLGRQPTPPRVLGALLLALCATGAKESGSLFVLLVGFLAWRRGSSLAPLWTGIAGAGVLVLWKLGGLASGSGFYPSPLSDPLEVLARYGTLLLAAPVAFLLPLPTDLAFHRSELAPWLLLAGGLVYALGWPLLDSVRRRASPAFGLFCAWFLAALAPQACAPLSDRLYFHALPPAAALLAMALARASEASRFRLRRGLALTLGLAISAGSLVTGQIALVRLARESREFIADAIELADREGAKTVVLTQAPNPLALLAPSAVAAIHAGRADIALLQLQLYGRALRLVAREERAIGVEVSEPAIGQAPMETVFLTRAGTAEIPAQARRSGLLFRWTPSARDSSSLTLEWEDTPPLFLAADLAGPIALEIPESGALSVPPSPWWLPIGP